MAHILQRATFSYIPINCIKRLTRPVHKRAVWHNYILLLSENNMTKSLYTNHKNHKESSDVHEKRYGSLLTGAE